MPPAAAALPSPGLADSVRAVSPARCPSVALLAASLAGCFNPTGNDDTAATTTTSTSGATTGGATASDPTTGAAATATSAATDEPTTAATTSTDTGDSTSTGASTGAPESCNNMAFEPGEYCYRPLTPDVTLAPPSDIVAGDILVGGGPELLAVAAGALVPNVALWRVESDELTLLETASITPTEHVATLQVIADPTLDVVSFGQPSHAFELFKTPADTTMWAPVANPVAIGLPVSWLAAGRLIGDIPRDVVAGDASAIYVWLDPDASMTQQPDVTQPLAGSRTGVLGEFTGDGFTDLAVLQAGGDLLVMYPGNGGPNVFDWGAGAIAINEAHALAAGDLEGDGVLELVLATSSSIDDQNCALMWFSPIQDQVSFPCGGDPQALTLVREPQGAGSLLVVADGEKGGAIHVLRGAKKAEFTLVATMATMAAPKAIAVADLDLDMRLDIAVASDRVEVFMHRD